MGKKKRTRPSESAHTPPPPKERDLGDEYGWKQVHGDVFRPPPQAMIFSALVGTGHQLAVASLCVILIAILGDLYTR